MPARTSSSRPQRPSKSRHYRHQRDHVVGYKRPPKSSQFKPGKSGNPLGRPKGAKGFATALKEALDQTLEFEERGKTRRITVRELIMKRLVNAALKGDLKATTFLYANEPPFDQDTKRLDREISKMSANDACEAYMRLIRADPNYPSDRA